MRDRLRASTEWELFAGTCLTQKVLGGLGNVDDNTLDLPSGPYRALTLRSFDAETGHWSIWWLDGRNPGHLDTPVVGGFVDGVGTFYAEDTLAGIPIRVRFRWTVPGPDAPRWEQAFSADSGQTWETNWVMDFVRSS